MTIYRGPGGTGDTNAGEDVFGPNSSITNLTGLTGPIQTPTYIKFDPNANHTALQGELTWNSPEGTLDLGLNGGEVVLQVGQEQHYRVLNQTGLAIANGTLVMYGGTDGNSGRLRVSPWNGTGPTKYIMGITTETIANGANGYVTSFGKVRGIQTNGANYSETWVDGEVLYAGSTGGLTKVLPNAPKSKTPVGVVVNAHGSNGTLFVRIQHGSNLGEDELVQLAALTNNDILQYDSTDGRFENRSLSAAGVQPTLVSGSNIKTINGESLLGSTNIPVTVAADIVNVLRTPDIGVSVQGYDANTAKLNGVTQNFTGTLQNGGSNVVVDTDIGSTVLAYDANLQTFVNTFTLPTVDSTNGFVLQTNGTGTLQLAAPGGVPDGDKGDITVSVGGTVWTVDNDVITYAKIQNVSATDKLLGRSTAGAGDIEEITCTAAGRALIDDADATSQRVTLSAAKSGANSDITSITGLTTALSIAQGGTGSTSGNLIAIGATGIGYGTGAGGTVTQATSKSTVVTLNKPTGQIITNNAALAAGASVTFGLANSLITANDTVIVNGIDALALSYRIEIGASAAGSTNIRVTNLTAGSLSDAIPINFAIIKGAIS